MVRELSSLPYFITVPHPLVNPQALKESIWSENPFAFDVAEAPGEQEDAKDAKDAEVEGEGHGGVSVYGLLIVPPAWTE